MKRIDSKKLSQNLGLAVIGYQTLIAALVAAYQKRLLGLPRANVLMFGPPGVGKTHATKAFQSAVAEVSGTKIVYERIQGRPDLMPEEFLAERLVEFDEQHHPCYVHRPGAVGRLEQNDTLPGVLHFDEMDKTPARTQHGLLESMEEQQLSLGDGRRIPLNFVLVATANTRKFDPASQPIPRATQDRFGSVVLVDYLPLEGDLEVLTVHTRKWREQGLDISADTSLLRALVTVVKLSQRKLDGYTEFHKHIKVPAGPRGYLDLYTEAAVTALQDGRTTITPDDVRSVALRTLRGRIEVRAEAEVNGKTIDTIIQDILEEVFEGKLVTKGSGKTGGDSQKKNGRGGDQPKEEKKESEAEQSAGATGDQDQSGEQSADDTSQDGSDKDDSQSQFGQAGKNGASQDQSEGKENGNQPCTKPTGNQGKRPGSFTGGFRSAASQEPTTRPFVGSPRQ